MKQVYLYLAKQILLMEWEIDIMYKNHKKHLFISISIIINLFLY